MGRHTGGRHRVAAWIPGMVPVLLAVLLSALVSPGVAAAAPAPPADVPGAAAGPGSLAGPGSPAGPGSLADPGALASPANLAGLEATVVRQVAALSDQVIRTQAGLVGARLDQEAAQAGLDHLQAEVRGMVVGMYVAGGNVPGGGAAAGGGAGIPRPYMEVAAAAGRNLLSRYAGRVSGYRARVAADEASLAGLHRLQADLAARQQALDVLVAAGQARLERQRSAQAAELAASDAARQAASASSAPTGGMLAATEAQQRVLASGSFGPADPARKWDTLGPVLTGTASWYGPGFDGRPTASGAIYDENAWTAASPDLPLGTALVVSANSRSVLVLVNDRGPYVPGRVLDLSHAAAQALGFDGLAQVTAQPVAPGP